MLLKAFWNALSQVMMMRRGLVTVFLLKSRKKSNKIKMKI